MTVLQIRGEDIDSGAFSVTRFITEATVRKMMSTGTPQTRREFYKVGPTL